MTSEGEDTLVRLGKGGDYKGEVDAPTFPSSSNNPQEFLLTQGIEISS